MQSENQETYTFTFGGKKYKCIDLDVELRDKDMANFKYLIKIGDWPLIEKRIRNMLMWHKEALIEVVN